MSSKFREIGTLELGDNPFQLIDKDWMLITAGSATDFNTMTASWGGLGSLWHRHVAFAFVRHQRYTYQFMEKAEAFTLSFFAEQYREALRFCGTNSGRDVDKIKATGLTPVTSSAETIYFQEARLVLLCRKIYAQDLAKSYFTVPEIATKIYTAGDFHRLYIGEITTALIRE